MKPRDLELLTDCGSLQEHGLVAKRLPDGRLLTNIEQVIVHHSPTGFECGYCGSGPADLALNVLHFLIPPTGEFDDVECFNHTKVSREAWMLHQDFKEKFIATLPEKGGFININQIRAWLEAEQQKQK